MLPKAGNLLGQSVCAYQCYTSSFMPRGTLSSIAPPKKKGKKSGADITTFDTSWKQRAKIESFDVSDQHILIRD